jgi:HD-GYP domain-containing protein (c-di-GMP phosphodiesterase class II)
MPLTSATYEPVEARDPSLQELLVALSFALDLTEGAVPGHAVRCCLLAARIAHEIGLEQAAITDLYYATLLKDVGCSSNSARVCEIAGGDDRMIKAGAKLEDWTRPLFPRFSKARLLWKQVLPGSSPLTKSARIAKMALTQHANNRDLISLRCERGSMIARKLGVGIPVAIAIGHLDEHWDGNGYPSGLRGRAIPILSRLMCVAQHLDAFCMQRGPQIAIDKLVRRSRRWFDPQLTAAAVSLARAGRLWTNCLPDDSAEAARTAVLQLDSGRQTPLSPHNIDAICETFADVVDAKSPFTHRHSPGVMDAAVAISNALGLAPQRLQLVRRAAMLHDLGKLGVPNTILDKPTRLSDAELEVVRVHPRLSAEILQPIAAFGEIALLAGEHHEKLDGSGYPNGLRRDDLSLESRLLAVADIFGALSEKRPYREARQLAEITAIMDREARTQLDPTCYEALRTIMARLTPLDQFGEEPSDERWFLPGMAEVEAYI